MKVEMVLGGGMGPAGGLEAEIHKALICIAMEENFAAAFPWLPGYVKDFPADAHFGFTLMISIQPLRCPASGPRVKIVGGN
jgi:hypothetical protein